MDFNLNPSMLNEVSKCQSVKLILNKTLKTYKTFFSNTNLANL